MPSLYWLPGRISRCGLHWMFCSWFRETFFQRLKVSNLSWKVQKGSVCCFFASRKGTVFEEGNRMVYVRFEEAFHCFLLNPMSAKFISWESQYFLRKKFKRIGYFEKVRFQKIFSEVKESFFVFLFSDISKRDAFSFHVK